MNNQTCDKRIPSICLVFVIVFITFSCTHSPDISIVVDSKIGSPVEHGLSSIAASLKKQNVSYEKVNTMEEARGSQLLVAGLFNGNGIAAELATGFDQAFPTVAEALSIWKTTYDNKPVWVINGKDDRGLMYALLDVAERISWSSDTNDPFCEVVPVSEEPEVVTRAISMYTMNRAYWESRFYDEDYWTAYMDMLAKNRFNTVLVIFGYENGGFLAPCYPYFFDVDKFPGVKMGNMSSALQEKNLNALNRMVELAHERGLDFKVGIWDHIYRGGIQTGGLTEEEITEYGTDHLVSGLDAENLPDYTKAALAKLLREVPGLDGIQFRMHNESGLKRGEEMVLFWREVFSQLKSISPDLKIDLRAKELPEPIIKIASDLGLEFTVTTKYWMEQLGLPFHPTHINRENQFERRHGFADMLRYPRDFYIHWRLWSGGTQRILLWGSPDYTQRFVRSTHLYDGHGFEVNEPLATKMLTQPHNRQPFSLLNPAYEYYTYEFERYWHFFQVFGRLGYNLNTPAEIWDHEFKKRFGSETGEVIKEALHKASWVLPTIVAACSSPGKFPTTRGWAEKQRFGNLPEYALAEGSDIQQYASFDTEAKLLIEGGVTAKRLPSATSAWFAQTHQELNDLIDKAEIHAEPDNQELHSTITDLKILSNLALYHSYRIPAALSYRIYKHTDDSFALDDAIEYEKLAIEAWQQIVDAAGDVYAPDLMFGIRESEYEGIVHHLSGHWSDELNYLERGLENLQTERDTFGHKNKTRMAPSVRDASRIITADLFEIQHQPIRSAPGNQPIPIVASVKAAAGVKWVKLRYRSVNQHLDYQSLPMETREGGNVFSVEIPPMQIDPTFDFMYFIEVMDNMGRGSIYPNLEEETPYFVVELERN
jgi:hypothetical protein